MGKRVQISFLSALFIVLIFSGIGLIADLLPEHSDSFFLMEGESHSVWLGNLIPGSVIHGSYSEEWGNSLEFFIIDQDNYDRRRNGLGYDVQYHISGGRQSFQFQIPYDDSWHAVFYDDWVGTFDYVTYGIHIGPFPGLATVIFLTAGLGVALVTGAAILQKGKSLVTEEPRAEPSIGWEPVPEEIPLTVDEPEKTEGVPISGLRCPNCGHENPGDAEFCVRCGRDLD